MKRYQRVIFIIFGAPLLLGACSILNQPSNKIEYYTLEYPSPKARGGEPLNLLIKVERFTVAPLYNSSQIIYRDASFKRNAYAYHKWRANPGDLVTFFLQRDIRESGLFRAVLPHGSRFRSSVILEGSVDEFFEWDRAANWEAVLTVSVSLVVEDEPDITKKVLFQKAYGARIPCKNKDPQAVAEAMSGAMRVVSGEILAEIYSRLKDVSIKQPR